MKNSSRQVAEYFQRLTVESGVPSEGPLLDALKLHCLLYYAQGVNLSMTGDLLFDEPVIAHGHGPCVSGVPCPCPNAEDTFNKIYQHTQVTPDRDAAADAIFEYVDTCAERGAFDELDYFIVALHLEWLDSYALIVLLSATFPCGHLLKHRAGLVERVEARLKTLAPEHIDGLMCGLRGVMNERQLQQNAVLDAVIRSGPTNYVDRNL